MTCRPRFMNLSALATNLQTIKLGSTCIHRVHEPAGFTPKFTATTVLQSESGHNYVIKVAES